MKSGGEGWVIKTEWCDEPQVYTFLCRVLNGLQDDGAFEVNFLFTVHMIEVISTDDYLFTQYYQLESQGPGSPRD